MARKVTTCANHSDIAASEKCYECGKRLCYNCIFHAFDRVFCGFQCIVVFVVKHMVRGVFGLTRWIARVLLLPFRWFRKLSGRGWVEALLCAGLIICFFFIIRLRMTLRSVESGVTQIESVADSTGIAAPVISLPNEGGMVTSNTLDIVGEAEGNRMISLSIDGRLKRVVLSEGGRFVFEGVRLHRGQNRLDVRAVAEDGRVSTLQTLVLTYANPTHKYLSRDFTRGHRRRKEIALTFDGGSIDNAADEILDFLKEKDVACTFFLTGTFIREYPETVKRIVQESHEVGNHTWSHPHLTSFAENRRHRTLEGVDAELMENELSRTASLFQVVTGTDMAGLWRAPFGEYNEEILGWAAGSGYKHVAWTVGDETMDTMDWVADKESSAYRTAEEVEARILRFADGGNGGANGAIVLMHLGTHREDDFPHHKLPSIIDALRERGYRLVTITEMLSLSEG